MVRSSLHWLIFRAGALPASWRYLAAAVLTLLAVALRVVLVSFVGETSPYLTSRLATVSIALVLGLGPGLLSALLSIGVLELFVVHGASDDTGGVLARALVLVINAAIVGAIGNDLRRSYWKLMEDSRQKDQFLAVLSHELRNPLAPIRNSLFLLKRPGTSPEARQRAVVIIDRQSNHLARLVDDLLDISRIVQNRVVLQRGPQDLAEVARGTLDDMRSTFTTKQVELVSKVPDEPIMVDGDRTRLAQAIGNLLHNAAKFTPAGGRVEVALRADAAAGKAVLEVSDSGVGISRAQLSALFEPFGASRTADRAAPGLGLGLALSNGFVTLLGGTLEAFSEGPDKGSRFVITLPLLPQAAAGSAPEVRPVGSQVVERVKRRILIVEDNRDAAESLRELLQLDGHQVEVALTGEEGLTKAADFEPEIVFCDLGLPGMDGFEVARRLGTAPRLDSPLLVALTGYALQEDRARALQAGFSFFIAKPPHPSELAEAVRARSLERH